MSIEMVQSTFCPKDDNHHIGWEMFVPVPPDAKPEGLVVYLIKCSTCLGLQKVHAERRWRVVGDPKRTLYRTEEEARFAAGSRPEGRRDGGAGA